MKRSAFDERRDQHTADHHEARGYTSDLMCMAHGCPNRWSYDAGAGRMCSAHASVSDRMLWPQVTQEQQDAETDRARARGEPKPPQHRYTHAEKSEILRKLVRIGTPEHPKAWAYALKAREERGDRLTQAQRTMWREAVQWLRIEADKREAA